MTWRRFRIAEIGHVYDGPHATPKPADSGPVFLGIKNIRSDGQLDFSEVRHVSPDEYPRWTKRVVPALGDVVFTYEATLHRYALIPDGFVGCLGRRTALVRPDQSKVDPRFLYYHFRSPKWWSKMERNKLTGATVDRIPVGKFPEFEIDLPDLDIQCRIADILSAYDDFIVNNNRRMKLLEEAIQLLYREWFVYLRFPGHERVKVVDGVPEGWTKGHVGDVIDFNPHTPFEKGALLPFIPMASLSTTSMSISKVEARVAAGGAKFGNGDTLLARITPCLENGKTGFVNFLSDEVNVATGSTEFIVMRARNVPATWVYCLARSTAFRKNAVNRMSGSDGRQRVDWRALSSLELLVPTSRMLEEFAIASTLTFEAIGVLSRYSKRLREARDLLLPRLMNGSIAV